MKPVAKKKHVTPDPSPGGVRSSQEEQTHSYPIDKELLKQMEQLVKPGAAFDNYKADSDGPLITEAELREYAKQYAPYTAMSPDQMLHKDVRRMVALLEKFMFKYDNQEQVMAGLLKSIEELTKRIEALDNRVRSIEVPDML